MKRFTRPTVMVALVAVLGLGIAIVALRIVAGPAYPLAKADHISSWTWEGTYADGGAKQQETLGEIERLRAGPRSYDVYIDIATEYELLGDGKDAYRYLSKAIALDRKRGAGYFGMGHLMDELGAFETARTAYTGATKADPGNVVYQAALEAFLAEHP